MADWDRRQLCSDGACIGLLDDDGVCKVCGHAAPNAGGAYRSAPATQESDDVHEAESDAPAADLGASRTDIPERSEPEWDNRQLCSNGACTGVIGEDGTCKRCGLAAA